jgi:cell division septation protein DedD
MGLIKKRAALLAAALLILGGGGLYAQNSVPLQLGMEIQSLEQRLASNISPAERHTALVRLARLRQLSGNIAAAAANWLDAAAANPNDDAALVSGAYCLAAIGEWERAALALRPLLASGKQGPSALQAQFLDACLRAWHSSGSGDASALTALAANPEFAALRPMIYYTLWQTLSRNTASSGAGEGWKSRLIAEFPRSPEARAADPNRQRDAPSVSAVQSPLWLLFPGASGSTVAAATPAATPPATPAATPTPPPATAPAARPAEPARPAAPASATATAPAASTVVLQTGLFGREANALAQIEALQRAGFTATASRKLVNGTDHWAVTVPGGQDSRKTAADLRRAGFDSFPIR